MFRRNPALGKVSGLVFVFIAGTLVSGCMANRSAGVFTVHPIAAGQTIQSSDVVEKDCDIAIPEADALLNPQFAIGKKAKVALAANAKVSYQDLDLPTPEALLTRRNSTFVSDRYQTVVCAIKELKKDQPVSKDSVTVLIIRPGLLSADCAGQLDQVVGHKPIVNIKNGKVIFTSDFASEVIASPADDDVDDVGGNKTVVDPVREIPVGTLMTQDMLEERTDDSFSHNALKNHNAQDVVHSALDCDGYFCKVKKNSGDIILKNDLESLQDRLVHKPNG